MGGRLKRFLSSLFVVFMCLLTLPSLADTLANCEQEMFFQGEQYTTKNMLTGQILGSGGVTSANSNYQVTDYIPLKAGDYYFTVKDVSTGNRPIRGVLYDDNHEVLDTAFSKSTTDTTSLQTFNFTVPTDCFIRIGTRISTTKHSLQPVNPIRYIDRSNCLIKIATTKYNDTAFSSVQTVLNTAISTIKSVVTNTINQTAAVATLQSTKQTRPNEECPTGKTCLLVEDMNGRPHWYEIITEYIPPEPELESEPELVIPEQNP